MFPCDHSTYFIGLIKKCSFVMAVTWNFIPTSRCPSTLGAQSIPKLGLNLSPGSILRYFINWFQGWRGCLVAVIGWTLGTWHRRQRQTTSRSRRCSPSPIWIVFHSSSIQGTLPRMMIFGRKRSISIFSSPASARRSFNSAMLAIEATFYVTHVSRSSRPIDQ